MRNLEDCIVRRRGQRRFPADKCPLPRWFPGPWYRLGRLKRVLFPPGFLQCFAPVFAFKVVANGGLVAGPGDWVLDHVGR